ncbi:ribonuclease III [Robertkochia sediminum]|uniref:ribonuclease III n=1 Tax=Robertkochia sediminum TaxID=2785326 RepID=UPI00193381E5|nr:ribonuclease III [Robertkochia sediminum]MBL7473820.1 ribonuclease III [Robertkochia sediminum]
MKFIRKILNSRSANDGDFFLKLTSILGFKPRELRYYNKAFTHRSMNIRDDKGNAINYERLEFLGDAMLSAIISHFLFNEVPSGDEGYLTKMRSKVVSREHLNELGKDLGLLEFLDSKINKDNFGENIHGNIFEALVGAIYLDRGYEFCKRFIYSRVVEPYVDIEQLEGKVISYKSLIIEYCQKKKKTFFFDVYDDDGNEDVKHFAVKLYINDKLVAKGRATSKKKAEESAAKRAYYALQSKIDDVV